MKIEISNNQLILIKDFYCGSYRTIFRYPFLTLDMPEMSSILIPKAICEGDSCDGISFFYEGKGYLIVMLEKNENYIHFKHIVFDELFSSMNYLDSAQIFKLNNKPNLPERYYKVETSNPAKFLDYKKKDGIFNYKFIY